MKPLALNELVRKGKPYMGRPTTLLQKIVNGDLLQLADEEGYVKVQSIKVTFKDESESTYTRADLKKEAVGQAFISDIVSVANQARSRKAQVMLTGSGSDHDPSIIGTWNLKELGKTHHFGGQKAGGTSANLGNQYEADLNESFEKFADHGGKYPDHVTEILKKICAANPGTCVKKVKHAGTANTRRPMKYASGGFYISAEGKKSLNIGKTLTDITVTIGEPNKKQNKDIYLSVKFGSTLSFFNIGVRGGGKGLQIFPVSDLKAGKIPDMGQKFLEMFNIDNGKFLDVFSKYDKDATSPSVSDHKESYKITGTAKKNLEAFCASGVGYNYWMVHYTGSELHCYEVDQAYMKRASTLEGDNVDIEYGGASGTGKRINIKFSTKEYDFSFNIRSKTASEIYPTHSNGDYFKR